MTIKQILGENIKSFRKKAGMTQNQLAEKLNISPNHLSNIELGIKFPSPELIERIIEVLDTTPSDVFYSPEYKGSELSLGKVDRFIDEAVLNLKKRIHEEM